jgi:hypothetical protein
VVGCQVGIQVVIRGDRRMTSCLDLVD